MGENHLVVAALLEGMAADLGSRWHEYDCRHSIGYNKTDIYRHSIGCSKSDVYRHSIGCNKTNL